MKCVALVVLAFSISGTASAQSPPPSVPPGAPHGSSQTTRQATAQEITVARQAFRAGVAAAADQNWDEARAQFTRSYEINPRLSALMNLATAEEHAGLLVEAAEHYRQYLDRADDGDENEAAVRQALLTLEPRVPKVRLGLEGLGAGDIVLISGAEISHLLLQSRIPVNPGLHNLNVSRSGTEIHSSVFSAVEGQILALSETLPPPEAPVAEELTAEASRAHSEAPINPAPINAASTGEGSTITAPMTNSPEPESGSVLEAWWFWTIIGVVAASVTVGIVLASSSEGEPIMGNGFGTRSNIAIP